MKKIGIFFLTLILLFTATASLFSCGEAPQTTVWFYGAEKPDDTVEAKVGDFYFEYGDCDVHVYTESG